jgi:nucleoside-diphosphate-sugar epimerase
VDGFLCAAKLLKSGNIGPAHQVFFLGSKRRLPLKDIAAVFEIACGQSLNINWGALDYRPNQIFQPCPAEPALPEWRPTCSLDEGFGELVRDLNLSDAE